MKLERINENQIRCTLTREDLADRNIRLSELAYGSEKTKTLFKDMMSQAQRQLGFEAGNIPLMIEAIPVGTDSIMLVITKVENPEELDSRFANFAPQDKAKNKPEEITITGADDLIGILNKIYEAKAAANAKEAEKEKKTAADKVNKDESVENMDFIRQYSFRNLDDVISAAVGLGGSYSGKNSLYKLESEKPYRLVLHKSSLSAEDFNKICNLLSEYGEENECSAGREAHMNEHDKIIIANDAIQRLGTIK